MQVASDCRTLLFQLLSQSGSPPPPYQRYWEVLVGRMDRMGARVCHVQGVANPADVFTKKAPSKCALERLWFMMTGRWTREFETDVV